ncbi:FusB/FusC family EF-G-binding protein [Paenibacillus protaetiae]|uniref:Elongation factor G-binding protein n=1 Tax=Paenibacillus protaetiae TaxID=2509456 RepID=A0A4P6F1V0_9BACL|nr:FusB/FusC family EF-G-binding protein [Paenibacillus protaetiae]QAY68109.1 elongation factor G-binding protein [Paenibacillus protaetiae]
MSQPFIRNHQYNYIKKQVGQLQRAFNTSSDPKVILSLRDEVQAKVLELFPTSREAQQPLLEAISSLQTAEECRSYVNSLEPYVAEMPQVTDNQLKKLFPKVKKLKTPSLEALDFRYVTYMGWTDIASGKMYLAYPHHNQLAGIEGRFTPTNKKGVCFVCSKHEEVALFTAITKSKPANASPDYYKAIGNYICLNSETCNRNITDVAALDKFFHDVLAK